MRDWASSGRVKIERADKHIRDLEAAITAFRGTSPYYAMPEVNPKGQHGVQFSVRVVHEIPPDLNLIAADAIHNLHVALDHLWLRAVHGSANVRRGGFPFLTAKSAKARFEGKVQGRVKAAFDILNGADAFRPDNPFWKIHTFISTTRCASSLAV